MAQMILCTCAGWSESEFCACSKACFRLILAKWCHIYSEHSYVSSTVRIWSRKSNIQQCILSAEIALTNIFFLFLPKVVTGRWQDWGRLDYTASHKIWVLLISITKWQETSVNKCHEHILLIIFITGVFIIDLHIYFLYTDIHSLMMLWRTFEVTTDRSVLCLHLG